MLTQLRADEREAFLEELAHDVSPSIDLYLRALAAGVVIGLGFRVDQEALLVAACPVGAFHGAGDRPGPGSGLGLDAFPAAAVGRPGRRPGPVQRRLPVWPGAWLVPAGLGSVLVWSHTKLNLIDLAVLLGGCGVDGTPVRPG